MKLTSILGVALSVVAAVLTGLNATTFGFVEPWHSLIMYGLPVIAAFGIAPITHEKLDTLLHLSGTIVVGLTTLDGVAIAAVQSFSWSSNAKGIVIGVLTLLGGVLFGVAPSPVPAPAPAPKGAP